MSVFTWIQTDLAHDVEYKHPFGPPTLGQRSIMEMIKGITNLGGAALKEYDRQLDLRFGDQYLQEHKIASDFRLKLLGHLEEDERVIGSNLKKRRKLKEEIGWVSKADVEHDHYQIGEILGTHYHDSGQWLLRLFDKWLAKRNRPAKGDVMSPVFWLKGSGLYLKLQRKKENS